MKYNQVEPHINEDDIKNVNEYLRSGGWITEHAKTKELEKFLIENVTLSTNSHVSDTDLNWIFTITHEEDFFISGSKKIVKEIISFFKSAKCIKYKDLKAK